MQISSTTRQSHTWAQKPDIPNQESTADHPADQVSLTEDLYDFKTNATMMGGMGLVGGAAGAIPVVGIFTNAHANEPSASTFTKATAVAASVANLVVGGLVLTGTTSAWSLAIPGVLGAASWASYGFDTRNHC